MEVTMRASIALTMVAVVIAAAPTAPIAAADTVEMRDGSLIQGKYVGGSAGTIRIELADGVKVLETSNVLALTFGGQAASSSASAAAQPAAATTAPSASSAAPAAQAAPPAQPVMVPAGSILTVRLD